MNKSDAGWFVGGFVGGAFILGLVGSFAGLISLEPTVPTGPRPPIIIKGRSLSFARKDAAFPLDLQPNTKYKYLFQEVHIDHLDGTLKLEADPQHFSHISRIEFSGSGTPNCSVSLQPVESKQYLLVDCDEPLKEKKPIFSKKHWEHPNSKLPSTLTITHRDGVAPFEVGNRQFEVWLDY